MSNATQKADQIAFHFYTKLFYVVNQARATTEPRVQPKIDKWFNLETPDSDLFTKEIRDKYKSISVSPPPPPLEIQVLLSIPELNNNQVLVYLAPDSSRIRVDPTPRYIVLETWTLAFTPRLAGEDDNPDVALPTIYKHGIPLFRSLFSLLRLLPTWKLYKRLRRRTGGSNRNGNLSIQLRVRTHNDSSDDSTAIMGFYIAPAANIPPFPTQNHVFPSVPHPMGTLSLSATFLTSPNFQLDELESLLSSRFLSLDEGPEFVPTLVKNQQRDSISSSPGSVAIRTSLPASPTSSVADKFVLPPRTGNHTRSMSRQQEASSSATAWPLKEEYPRPPSGLAVARLRKESTGSIGRGSDLPSAPPSPLPIRRPHLNPVHPFKSNTLSSGSSLHSPSPSLRQASPLSSVGIPSLSSRPIPSASPTAPRVPPSPIGIGNRPSPPFAPSSLGGRSNVSAEGVITGEDPAGNKITVPTRKRYSSSFGHRYAASGGAGSEGSAGSADRKELNDRPGSASFLSTNTDDDEISVFVQDIDSRKPLSGQHRIHRQREDDRSQEPGPRPSHHWDIGIRPAQRTSPHGPMLTSEVEIDEKLKRMNEAFLASLKGLGGNEGGSRSVRRRDKERARERHDEHELSIDSGGNESLQSGEAPAPHRTPAILNLEPGSRRRHGSGSVDTGSGEA
ncbi:autophagy-related protein 13-domain-containing protein [Infundibulicybe gibba]|nr:autophagy-related protein 13-domain-containing protein [Infundibulicybe gibba]